ncbi:hypothetical protein FKW77_007349 [Venturia effusa]|uniref:Uncharacterized protein n=1 Tax=Venturia effusa TaxID=50376 RepID=A0A517L3N7_9PEZI|nr:hypothetical protein FKW77_007349 [Venturia effusa]
MARLNGGPKAQAETPVRRNPSRGAAAKVFHEPAEWEEEEEDEDMSDDVGEEPVVKPAPAPKGKGKGRGGGGAANKAMPPPPVPMPDTPGQQEDKDFDIQESPIKADALKQPGTPQLTKGRNDRAPTPALATGRVTRAQQSALKESLNVIAEDVEMNEDDGASKSKVASKKPTTRNTRGQTRAGTEMSESKMGVSVQMDEAGVDEDEAPPKVAVKSKAAAAKKATTMRKTRGQNVLGQIAEAAAVQDEKFFDAEEEFGVKVKAGEVASEIEDDQVQEVVKPVKKRGRPAKKVVSDDIVVVEEGVYPVQSDESVEVPEEVSIKPKPKRGRKPTKKTQPPKLKHEEIGDSDDDNDNGTLDQKLARLSLGQMTLNNNNNEDSIEEEDKPKYKPRGRPRKNTQNKKNASLDVSGLELALTYFGGIRDLAMGDIDEDDIEKILEMTQQGIETVEAALASVQPQE